MLTQLLQIDYVQNCTNLQAQRRQSSLSLARYAPFHSFPFTYDGEKG